MKKNCKLERKKYQLINIQLEVYQYVSFNGLKKIKARTTIECHCRDTVLVLN